MTREKLRALVLDKLLSVAPDIDPQQLDPEMQIRDQYDFDSMDFLNFAIALGKELQLDIPEKDYTKLLSLNGVLDYLYARLN